MDDVKKLTEGLRYCDEHYEPTDCKLCPIHKECGEYDAYTRSLAADAIEAMQSQIVELNKMVPKWVSADDPPKQNGLYWCCIRRKESEMEWVYQDTAFYENSLWMYGGSQHPDVVLFWMPLPKLPEEVTP